MRKLLLAAILLSACDRPGRSGDLSGTPAIAATVPSAADLLALRVPRSGGRGRVLNFPALDSVKWTSGGSVPGISKVLSFDVEAGTIIYVDSRGGARSLDLRLGQVSPATQLRLTGHATADAWNVYGVLEDGTARRSTPSATFDGRPSAAWSFRGSLPVRDVFPQPNGALLVVGSNDTTTIIWRVYPPEKEATDSLVLERTHSVFRTMGGDRLYLATGNEIIAVSPRTLDDVSRVRVPRGARELVTTPSGNQLFVLGDSSNRVTVVDRYKWKVARTVRFPAPVRALRMDPLGRYLLARPFAGDTAWVLPIADLRGIRSIATVWREDLPTFTWDGSLAAARGKDVQFVDIAANTTRKSITNGASDYWYFFAWKGFRPRSQGTAEPPSFAGSIIVDTTELLTPRRRIAEREPPRTVAPPTEIRRDSVVAPKPAPAKVAAPEQAFIVSFAVLRSDSSARSLARSIRVRGQTARVVEDMIDATRIYRVILGPYRSRDEADRIGRASGKSFWVYAGSPP